MCDTYGVVSKDFKKGGKDATKAIKKLDCVSKENIQMLMDKTVLRTANTEYLNGFFDVCRQQMAVAA